MGKAGTKQAAVIGIAVVLLGGLAVGINLLGSRVGEGGGKEAATKTKHTLPKLDPAQLAAQWPDILAHAAAPPRGSASARYTLAEFGDFQCPQCGLARPKIEKLLADSPAQANLVFLHRPFPNIHKWAIPSGQASVIAAAQGKFWPMYDVLYSHQDDLEPGFYGDYAAKAGLDKAQFQKAFDAGQGRDKITGDAKFADTVGVQLTPTILVRDNIAKTVRVYVGLNSRKNAEDSIPYAGLDALLAQPPWASTAQALPPSPQ